MTVVDAMRDPNVFARWFRGDSWHAWFAYLNALFALPMDERVRAAILEHLDRLEQRSTREPDGAP